MKMLALLLVMFVLPVVAFAAPHWEADLTWTQAAPDNEEGYRIERKFGVAGVFAQIGATPLNVVAFTDVGPYTDGQVVCWRILAFNLGGAQVTTGPETCAPAPTQFPGQPGPPSVQWRWVAN